MSGVRRVRIDSATAGQRIDNFLMRELRGVPRTAVYRLLRRGEVRVNGGRIRQTYRLQAGDEVRLPPVRDREALPASPSEGLAERLRAGVLHEDDHLLVIDKPGGLAAHGGSGLPFGLIEALRAIRPRDRYLDLCHRLDRGTSGCIVVARRRSALRSVHAAIREGRMRKGYVTLLTGVLPRDEVIVDSPLARRSGRGGESEMHVSDQGKPSRSAFRVRERIGAWTLAEVELFTGRMHQIRVHAASIGCPVAGDDRYGDDANNRMLRRLGLARLFLHASEVALPATDETPALSVRCGLPGALEAFLDRLRGEATHCHHQEMIDHE